MKNEIKINVTLIFKIITMISIFGALYISYALFKIVYTQVGSVYIVTGGCFIVAILSWIAVTSFKVFSKRFILKINDYGFFSRYPKSLFIPWSNISKIEVLSTVEHMKHLSPFLCKFIVITTTNNHVHYLIYSILVYVSGCEYDLSTVSVENILKLFNQKLKCKLVEYEIDFTVN